MLGTIRGRVGFEGGKGVLIFLVDGRRHEYLGIVGDDRGRGGKSFDNTSDASADVEGVKRL